MDEGEGAPPRLRPPPPLCQDRTGRSPPPSLHRLSLLGDVLCLQRKRHTNVPIKLMQPQTCTNLYLNNDLNVALCLRITYANHVS